MAVDEKLRARFFGKFDRDEVTQCWNWKASLAGKGYGQIKLTGQRRQEYAHRISYEVHFGEIPAGLYVLHKCDNPKCVNPSHLWLGTNRQNLEDMAKKDRSTHGERNGNHALTERDVLAIKALLAQGTHSQTEIGAMFGVGQMQVSRIKRGEQWSRVQLPISTH